jgi:hypothetical protein
VGHVAHRAVEDHGEIDLIVVVAHLNNVDQTWHPDARELREHRTARGESRQQGNDEVARAALSA